MRQKVIYIAGCGHSGSTLLDLLLGSHSNIESVGEVTQRSLTRLFSRSDESCTCGLSFADCVHWRTILGRLESRSVIDPNQLLKSPRPDHTFAFIEEVLGASERSIYLESTKNVSRLKTLLACPFLDVYVIHLIRDPRAVAYSWSRKGDKFFARAVQWRKINREIEVLQLPTDRTIKIYYEEIVTTPGNVVSEIMRFCGEDFESGQMQFKSRKHHNIAGNRMRLADDMAITPDDKYIGALGEMRWWASVALTFPALLRHNYPLTKGGMRWRLARPAAPGGIV